MARLLFNDRRVVRALTSAFPGSDDAYESLSLEIGAMGTSLTGVDKPRSLLGILSIEASAFLACEGRSTLSVDRIHLTRALELVTSQVFGEIDFELELNTTADGMVVTSRMPPKRIVRRSVGKILEDAPALPRIPYDNQPVVRKVPPTLLAEVLSALQDKRNDSIQVTCRKNALVFETQPDVTVGRYEFGGVEPVVLGSTRVLEKTLKDASQFGTKQAGTDAMLCDLAFINQGTLRIVYYVPYGTMTYWIPAAKI